MEHVLKMDAIRQHDKELVKMRARQIEERLNKGAQRIEEHKLALSGYFSERREINEQRTQIAKSNRQLVALEEVL